MVATPRQQENELLRQRSARALVQLRKIPYTVLEMGTEHVCGCFVRVKVMYGWRCVYCMPPLGMMEEARSIVEECGAVHGKR